MLAAIAAATEAQRPAARLADLRTFCRQQKPSTAAEGIASVVEHALETVDCAAVFVPARSGTTARMISRFKPGVWVVAVAEDFAVSQGLAFSFGVHSFAMTDQPGDWRDFAQRWLHENKLSGSIAMLVAGPSARAPDANHRIEFLRVGHQNAGPKI